jgi:hypothetical protein
MSRLLHGLLLFLLLGAVLSRQWHAIAIFGGLLAFLHAQRLVRKLLRS